jgi:hypothetical protein
VKEGGVALVLIGVALALGSFLLGNTVETYSASAYLPERVVNLGKMQLQTMVFASGAVLFLAGAIFTAAAAIVEKLDGLGWATPAPIAAELDVRPPVPGDDSVTAAAEAARAEDHEASDREFGRIITIVGVMAITAIVLFALMMAQ